MYQVTFESILPETSGLRCRTCKQDTVTLYSKWRDFYNCYYDHEAVCSNCGVKSTILEYWNE